jgi:hypothetical protein
MNNREVVVQRIIEWLDLEALSYIPKQNNSDKFRATIELNQGLDLDIQLTSQRPTASCSSLQHTWLLTIKEISFPARPGEERDFSPSSQMGTAQY